MGEKTAAARVKKQFRFKGAIPKLLVVIDELHWAEDETQARAMIHRIFEVRFGRKVFFSDEDLLIEATGRTWVPPEKIPPPGIHASRRNPEPKPNGVHKNGGVAPKHVAR